MYTSTETVMMCVHPAMSLSLAEALMVAFHCTLCVSVHLCSTKLTPYLILKKKSVWCLAEIAEELDVFLFVVCLFEI